MKGLEPNHLFCGMLVNLEEHGNDIRCFFSEKRRINQTQEGKRDSRCYVVMI